MQIKLNNRTELFKQDELSLAELILIKNFTFKLLVTKINGKLVKKEHRDSAIIRDGDDVMVLHMISGG